MINAFYAKMCTTFIHQHLAKIQPLSQAEPSLFTIFPPYLIEITVKDTVGVPVPSSVDRSAQPAWLESVYGIFWDVVFPCAE